MKTFLQSVGAVLTTGLKATIQLEGMAGGVVKMLYTPDIGPTPENASDTVVQLRAAMAKPMVVTGTPEEIEEAFAELIAKKAEVVARGLSALDEIERLASKAIDEAKSKPATKAAATPAPNVDDDEDEEEEAGQTAPSQQPVPNGAAASAF